MLTTVLVGAALWLFLGIYNCWTLSVLTYDEKDQKNFIKEVGEFIFIILFTPIMYIGSIPYGIKSLWDFVLGFFVNKLFGRK